MHTHHSSRPGRVRSAQRPTLSTCPPAVSRPSRVAAAIGLAWALVLGPAPAWAEQLMLSDIAAGHGGFVIDGDAAWVDHVASAGDVNGDGLTDIVFGTAFDRQSYVIFGKTGTTAVKLSDVAKGIGGFVIKGGYEAGWTVAGLGDVNGDGRADVILDDPGPYRSLKRGRSFVVFGKSDTRGVNLDTLEQSGGGFVIEHARYTYYPTHVASAGDINGDGLDDLLVARPPDHYYGYGGFVYVVFGKTSSAPVPLAKVERGEGGFAIHGGEYAGKSVAGVGDINGDGLADVALGWDQSPYFSDDGRCFVVFGKTDGAAVAASAILTGQGGFVIRGAKPGDQSCDSLAGAGDVDGDGLADLVVGSPGLAPNGGAHVVFGKKTTEPVELSAVAAGVGGFVMHSDSASAVSEVAGVGDVNGDGLGDVMVGSDYVVDPVNFVIYGKTDTAAVDLSAVSAGIGGFEIRSEFKDTDNLVSGGGDVNGDGLADLLVASPSSGRAYVIFGATTGAFEASEVDRLGGAGDDAFTGNTKSNVFVGGAGDDTLVGNGAADVLYGGAGDDVFLLKSSNVKALFSKFGMNGNTEHLARLDGGAGLDTLRLVGADVNLDIAKTAGQGAGMPDSTSRIESLERIDLTGTGDNTLTLGVRDVQDMTAMNIINSGTQAALGWINGTYAFPSKVGRHQLVVDGDAGDVMNLGRARNGWENAGTVISHGVAYDVYNTNTKPAPSFERVQVIVAHAVRIVMAR